VFIARGKPDGYWPRAPGEPEYSAHWEADEPRPHIVEEGPGWDNVDDAIAWGRERAPIVVVILAASDRTYSAGEQRLPSLPEWPPADW
jgi:hypothetical protein